MSGFVLDEVEHSPMRVLPSGETAPSNSYQIIAPAQELRYRKDFSGDAH
jgi:hypothetical protein